MNSYNHNFFIIFCGNVPFLFLYIDIIEIYRSGSFRIVPDFSTSPLQKGSRMIPNDAPNLVQFTLKVCIRKEI